MIYSPFKYFRLKREAEINNWLTDWVTDCLKREDISYAGKVQLLSGYYAAAPKSNVGDKE